MDRDKIARCTAAEWTIIRRPLTGAFAAEFDGAERQLRAKQTDANAAHWQTEFMLKGDGAAITEVDGLHFLPDVKTPRQPGNGHWKFKVLLFDASTVKSEKGFICREGIVTLNDEV
jgi:hypothetical protein